MKKYYDEEGNAYHFNSDGFKQSIENFARKNGKSQSFTYGVINAKFGNISAASAKNWCRGHSPSELDYGQIVKLARMLGASPDAVLTRVRDEQPANGGEAAAPVNAADWIDFTSERTVRRSLYVQMVLFIDEFRHTKAFQELVENDLPRRSRPAEDIRRSVLSCGFDLPSETSRKLLEYVDRYLLQMEYYDEFCVDIWNRRDVWEEYMVFDGEEGELCPAGTAQGRNMAFDTYETFINSCRTDGMEILTHRAEMYSVQVDTEEYDLGDGSGKQVFPLYYEPYYIDYSPEDAYVEYVAKLAMERLGEILQETGGEYRL